MAISAQPITSANSANVPISLRMRMGMVRDFAAGKPAIALKMHGKLYPLFKDLFIETNPGPVKAALAMMRLIEEEYRLPLVPMHPKNREALKATLKACGVLK